MLSPQEKSLAKVLVERSIISSQQLQTCIQSIHSNQSFSLSDALVKHGFISQEVLSRVLRNVSQVQNQQFPTASIPAKSASDSQYKTRPTPKQMPPTKAIPQANLRQAQGQFLHYQIDKELGRGGMGVVYRATDLKLKRTVAIKMILANQNLTHEQISRFMREAEAMAKLKHPNIVEIYDMGETPKPYLIMEYIEGQDLLGLIKNGNLKYDEIARIIKVCAEAMFVAHKNKIIHRDIKPANILVGQDKSPKIMDFGLAKETENSVILSQEGSVVGTLAYMPPEQASGEAVTLSVDVYSLGATLYHALTGRPPFQGVQMQVMNQIFNEDPIAPRVLNPETPVDLEAICMKCMEKKPQKRYATSRALAKDLEAFLENRPIIARPATKWRTMTKWMARNKAITMISIGSIVLYTIGTITALLLINLEKDNAVVSAHQAKVEQKRAEDALKALAIEKKASDDARKDAEKAKEESEKAREIAEKAEQQAQKEKQKAQVAEYYSNIVVASKYYVDYQADSAGHYLDKCSEELRNWEWYWLKNRRKPYKKILDKSKVHKIRLDSSGRYAVFLIDDGTKFVLFDLQNETILAEEQSPTIYTYCCFDPSNRYVVLGQDHKVLFWNIETKQVETVLQNSDLDEGSPVSYVDFSSSGNLLIVGHKIRDFNHWDREKTTDKQQINIVVWDIKKQQVVTYLKAHNKQYNNDVNACVFFSNSRFISVGECEEGSKEKNTSLEVWDTKKRKNLNAPLFHNRTVRCLALSPDRKMLVTGSDDTTLVTWPLWSKSIDEQSHRLIGHNRSINDCCFSPNGEFIASASDDSTVRVWKKDSKRFVEYCVFLGHTKATSCRFINNEEIISSDIKGQVLRWNIHQVKNSNPLVIKNKSRILEAHFHPKKDQVAVVANDDIVVHLYDLKPLQKQKSVNLMHLGRLNCCAFTSDGKSILTGADDGVPRLWDFGVLEAHFLKGHTTRSIKSGTFSPDNTILACCGADKRINFWKNERNEKKELNKSLSIEFQDDLHAFDFVGNDRIVTGDYNGVLKLWKIDINRSFKQLIQETQTPCGKILECTYSDKNRQIVIAGENESNNLIIWDLDSWQLAKSLKGHQRKVQSCDFSQDGTRVISGSNDGTARIWKVDTDEPSIQHLLIFDERVTGINHCEFSPDNKKILVAGDDGLVKIWEILE